MRQPFINLIQNTRRFYSIKLNDCLRVLKIIIEIKHSFSDSKMDSILRLSSGASVEQQGSSSRQREF